MSAAAGTAPRPETAAAARPEAPGSFGRFLLVAGLDFKHNLKRPLFWILILTLALTTWGLSNGNVRISSGDSQVGGTKAWITSEFASAQMLSLVVFLFYSFFVAVGAGMAVIQDHDLGVGPILHTTRLSPSEYVFGKFTGAFGAFGAVLALHLVFMAFFNHVVPNDKAVEIRGPFSPGNYLIPSVFIALPMLFFLTATSFAVGIRAGKPILIFFLPVVLVVVSAFFLWDWSPQWLAPKWNRLLMILDPAGVRWLSETYLKVDRGVDFYNKAPIAFDRTFLLNRLWLIAAGAGSLIYAERWFKAGLRGEGAGRRARARARRGATAVAASPVESVGTGGAALEPAAILTLEGAALGRRGAGVGLFAEIWTVLRAELKELGSQPGLYLFIPIILLETIGTSVLAVGAFDTPLLATPGLLASRSLNTITLLTCLLLLFYAVESLERERATGLSPIYRATRVRTGSVLAGKILADSLVGVVIVLATFVACAIVILVQHRVALDLKPFIVIWGFLLLPTLIVWTSFVLLLMSITGNRYTTYALGLGALILTGYLQMTGKMTWVGNWDIWAVLRWTDMGLFELDRNALIVNRAFALLLAGLFLAVTIRIWPRRERDFLRTSHRFRPGPLAKSTVGLLPFLVPPLAAGIALLVMVQQGFQGKPMEKKLKDYWRKNVATWTDAPLPAIAGADVDLELNPARRWFRVNGTYRLVNHGEKPLAKIPLTGGPHWQKVEWTLDGAVYKPEDRLHLYVFTPEKPLAPGDSIRIGFRCEGSFPTGITKNGGGNEEFILPSGVVLTSFTPSFVPVLGYLPDVGVDKENHFDSKEYPDDFYEGITPSGFPGGGGEPYPTRIRITGPADYTYNSVGTLVSDQVAAGRRTVVWQSDHPVNFFNVVAGRWAVRQGKGTSIYYHPSHGYNIDEMAEALDAARRWYSEWFMPFPWKELKLSEFPGLASYAQGFPTNITFSENIGFLTRSDPKANAAFLVTAHESAHQWWGNILVPGKGPGGDILSEGMSHFSTILLFEQVKGPHGRIEFCKGIESRYGDRRQVDSERPLVRIDGTRDGDNTVIYDKGGWVFWMLLNEMGRDRCLAGLRAFISKYSTGPDHAVLQDFVSTLRPFAPDTTAYDAFVKQWFFSVVVPEYRLDNVRIETADSTGASGAPVHRWIVQVRVTNRGSGVMPVEVAAVRGERFKDAAAGAKAGKNAAADAKAGKDAVPGDAVASDQDNGAAAKKVATPDYADARVTVTLGAGESRDVSIPCAFRPEKVLVDPDALVLQLNRKLAVTTVPGAGPLSAASSFTK